MGGGGKVPYVFFKPSRYQWADMTSYPKHVWSPAGGWYAQPANWKTNTAIMGFVMFGFTLAAWNVSAEKEYRTRMPEPNKFFPSRW